MANYLLNWGTANKQTSLAEERIRRVLPDLIRADSIAQIMADGARSSADPAYVVTIAPARDPQRFAEVLKMAESRRSTRPSAMQTAP